MCEGNSTILPVLKFPVLSRLGLDRSHEHWFRQITRTIARINWISLTFHPILLKIEDIPFETLKLVLDIEIFILVWDVSVLHSYDVRVFQSQYDFIPVFCFYFFFSQRCVHDCSDYYIIQPCFSGTNNIQHTHFYNHVRQ